MKNLVASISVFLILNHATVRGEPDSDAIAFLRSSQAADGTWGGASGCGSAFDTTALVVRVLGEVEATPSIARERGLLFLESAVPRTNVELAHRALAFAASGRDNSADLARLTASQIPGPWPLGGWGLAERQPADVLTTALCLEALGLEALGTSPAPPDVRGSIRTLILAWYAGPFLLPATTLRGAQGSLYVTARALEGMNPYRSRQNLVGFFKQSIEKIRSRQDASGGYGDGEPTVLETAVVLHCLKTSRFQLEPSEEAAASFLRNRQGADGSWEGDPFSTAWALRALAVPVDTDADGLPDDFEAAHGLDPLDFFDREEDPDLDGLNNLAEHRAGTDPQRADTDGDGLLDGLEIANGSSPLDPGSKNRAPAFSTPPPLIAAAGSEYRYAALAADPEGDPLSYRLARGPAGMSVDGATGTVAWSIPTGMGGLHPVAIECRDTRGAKGFQTFTLTVVPGGVDLSSGRVDISGFRVDTQTLIASGAVQVDVLNQGSQAFTGAFDVTLFVDRNGSRAYEPDTDILAGASTFSGAIGPLGSASLAIPASAAVTFRDAALHAFVDSGRRIPETDEGNNVASSGEASLFRGSLADSMPVIEWWWKGPDLGTDVDVISHPLVANLDDDNGDGLVDERDVPEVIFGGSAGSTHGIYALSGDTGELKWVYRSAIRVDVGMAIADLDGDGAPEVVALTSREAIFALNADGTLKWTKAQNLIGSTLSIADLDGDTRPEIISGDDVFDHEGNLLWRAVGTWTGAASGSDNFPLPLDLDLDGDLELVHGFSAVDYAGNMFWKWNWNGSIHSLISGGEVLATRPASPRFAHAFTAAIQADDDPYPEIVCVGPTYLVNAVPVWILEHTGHIKWGPVPVSFPDPERSSAVSPGIPCVADFDGDGRPEIAIQLESGAAAHVSPREPSKYGVVVLDDQGNLLWDWETKTGSIYYHHPVAFDFDGDGASEIAVFGRNDLFILDGRKDAPRRVLYRVGSDRYQNQHMAVIADIDNDGNAEVVGHGYDYSGGTTLNSGIFVIGDANDQWGNARRIWNQTLYDGTNIGEDGSVPVDSTSAWLEHGLGHGTARRQLPIDGHTPHDAPDLTVSRLRIDLGSCPDVVLIARAGNAGSLHAPRAVPVEFWHGDPDRGGSLIGVAETTRALYPGEHEDVRLAWPGAPPGGAEVHAWVLPRRPRPVVQSTDLIRDLYARAPYAHSQSTLSGNPHQSQSVGSFPGIDGSDGTFWSDRDALAAGYAEYRFYEVFFALPVRVESITLRNSVYPAAGWLTAELSLFNYLEENPVHEAHVTFDAKDSLFDVPDLDRIGRIRFLGNDVAGGMARVNHLAVAGSFEEPLPVPEEGVYFRINEGRDDNNRASAFLPFACPGQGVNRPPEISSVPIVTASATEAYGYSVIAADPDGSTVEFSLMAGPPGLAIEASTGRIEWSPGFEHLGEHRVDVEAKDPQGAAAAQAYVLVVEARINRPPSITSAAPSIAAGESWSHQNTAVDPDGDALTWLLVTGPSEMAIDASGLLSWSPVPAGAQLVVIRVEDGRGGLAEASFSLSTGDSAGDPPLIVVDFDEDGHLASDDCADADPEVNPGRIEIPGNGKDDDCNPATPDVLFPGGVVSILRPDRLRYTIGQTAILEAQLTEKGGAAFYSPVLLDLVIRDSTGMQLHSLTETAGALPPGGIIAHSFSVITAGWPPGSIEAVLTPRYGGESWSPASARFEVLESENPFTGVISGPREVPPGNPFSLMVQVENVSRRDLDGVVLELKLYETSTKTEARTWSSGPLSIVAGGGFTREAAFTTEGLPPGGLLVGLIARVGGKDYPVATGRVDLVAPSQPGFQRGDVNSDGLVDVSDPVFAFSFLFLGGAEPVCIDALDANDDGLTDITDGIYSLNFLFLGGSEIPAPAPGSASCGPDPTEDGLGDCRYPQGLCGGG